MAENKKSYVGYVDWGDTFDMLDDEAAGKLIKHFYAYVRDENPVLEDKILQIAFHSIKLQLKRDLVKWDNTRAKRSEAGKASAESKKAQKESEGKPTLVDFVEPEPTKSTVNDTVTVTVNDTVNELESNTTPAEIKAPAPVVTLPDLSQSNLFRKPRIPALDEVKRVFIQNGGTFEMADTFFENNQATGWYSRGSPITNFSNLVPSFVRNWKQYEAPKGQEWKTGLTDEQIKQKIATG